jgi:hypothetical protein
MFINMFIENQEDKAYIQGRKFKNQKNYVIYLCEYGNWTTGHYMLYETRVRIKKAYYLSMHPSCFL